MNNSLQGNPLDVQKVGQGIPFKPFYHIAQLLLFVLLLSAFKSSIDINPPFPAITRNPKRVALLLPLQGEWKAISEAIQSGFMIANESAGNPLIINTFNTKSYHTIQASYRRATHRGADLIIGPLLKADVQSLARSSSLKSPVLTLNYLDVQQEAPANFYQFGLSPLDEVAQITQQAKTQQHQSALILVPDNAWGTELARSFIQHWEALGGIVQGCLRYSSKLPILSHQLRTLLEFSPPRQRREDFDVIFLGATATLGRQINPLLAFYFASNVPVYATATIYDEATPVHLNRDLDNIMICDTPWSIGITHIQPHIRTQCIIKAPQHFSHYARYYALGVDAFQLALQLFPLDQNKKKMIAGASGELTLNKNRYIVRKPPCAQFKRGIIQPLNTS